MKTIKLISAIILIVLSIGIIPMTINYEKNKYYSEEAITLIDSNNNLISGDSTKLNIYENIIIIVSVIILLFSIFYIINYILSFSIKYHYSYIILLIIISLVLSYLIISITNTLILTDKISLNENEIVLKASYEIKEKTDLVNKTYYSNDSDKNILLVKASTNVSGCYFKKNSDTNNSMSSKIYGINSTILVLDKLNIKNSTIISNGDNSIGVFASNNNSYVDMDNVIIETNGSGAHALSSTNSGNIIVSNSKIKTSSIDSSAISSTKNGSINISTSVIETNGSLSPLFKTSSKIIVNDSIGDANNSYTLHVFNEGSVVINNSELKSSGLNNNNNAGILISRNLDSSDNTKSFLEINDSKLEIKEQSREYANAPMIKVIDNNSSINIKNTSFKYGSNVFLDISNTKKYIDNIKVNLDLYKTNIVGNIKASNNSSLELNILSSIYRGVMNGLIDITLDSDSIINLAGDSYINSINDYDSTYSNIVSNGYTIYVNKKIKTIKLKDGGYIKSKE